jgi:NAD+ kinase
MRFAFVARHGCEDNLLKYQEYLKSRGHELDSEHPEVVIVLGGDGTILRAVREYQGLLDTASFVGINFGKLGFYTDFTPDDFEKMIGILENHEFQISRLSLLEYRLSYGEETESGLALNEITLLNPLHTQIIEVFINGNHFESFKGTGIAISTPSGSTAYNKSLGGAVVDSTLRAFQMTEIASINNRIFATIGSPVILGEQNIVLLKAASFEGTTFTCDDLHQNKSGLQELVARLSDKKVMLITRNGHSFWERVRKAFLG